MAILKFRLADKDGRPGVLSLLEHTNKSKLHKLTMDERAEIYGEDRCGSIQRGEEKKGKPGLWLVKDAGIYLMSNGSPAMKIDNNVTYAEGYGPDADYGDIRDAAGGDDFVIMLPVDFFKKMDRKESVVFLKLTEDAIHLLG
jgi:hypothetical protein